MNVAITSQWESFVQRLVNTGRYRDASEVVGAGLSRLQSDEGEFFPVGSLAHLYTAEDDALESALAAEVPVPEPHQV